MKRRIFLHTGSAAMASALAACGGGGGGGTTATTDAGTGVTTSGLGATTSSGSTVTGTTAPPGTPTQSATSTVPGIAYPFGSRLQAYVAGTLPTNASNAQMDSVIVSAYNAWKANGIVDVPTVPGGKALRFASNYITVSEAMGYAMLIS